MGLTNIRLGDYIERSTQNNKDLEYGTDLIVAFSGMQTGRDECIRIALSTLPFEETETMIKGVYAPERFLEIFRDYIYFQDSIYDTVSIKYHPRIAKVLLDNKKVKEIENYYKKCADDGATYEDIEASKKAMSSMEIILGEPSRLERLATDIHNHYVSSCAGDPDRIQKASIQ